MLDYALPEPSLARGIRDSTGKWVSNVLLISITFSLVKPPPAASSEIALRHQNGSDYVRAVRPAAWRYSLRLIGNRQLRRTRLQSLLTVNKPTLIKDISGAGALHPMSAAPAVSMSVRGRPRFPLRVLGNRIRESQ